MAKEIRYPTYKKYLFFGYICAGIILFVMLYSFFFLPYSPTAVNASEKLSAPSASHWFGTDDLGRDVLSRTFRGSQLTVLVSVLGIAIALLLGMIMGSVAGYVGGIIDNVVMLLSDSIMAFPGILLALVFVAIQGPGVFNIIFALGIVFAPSYARVIRTGIRQLKNREYILQASLIGVKPYRLLFVHLFPGLLPQLSPAVVVGMANMALAEAGMSYLGLGVQPPFTSWGKMLKDAHSFITYAPWTIIFPSVFLIIYVLGLYFLSEGISLRYGSGGARS